ncbi:recombinase family protein [Pokkaliibacter sp. MBI-7]|uniref:recombinase family protein n=1 Tax=Pokkaliibacter sp. MBI-7 TaxID=3040600 RepID=UPI002447A728|nr:recombinase family protein [Pokkaliibacter sp. MBI-7]MDH2430954.1 recombinase family protein [Pokkaliibacter sp. MBI-7]MDH2434714.1 recombinase family protein [Pokkaliibacter sp. MBI-7]MDH2436691.1 recombinase family protein [Pokkaliibacter sp. MBI-7]
MSRIFVYARVSTADQHTDNQIQEVVAAGFAVNQRRIVTEHISGSVAALERPQFARLLDRLEPGDILIVTKLDRLGRNAMDVRATIELLAEDGIHVHCLALGGADLTSPAGRMTMMVMNAVAEFERDLLIERTQAGLARARAEGKRLGRPPALSDEDQVKVIDRLAAGVSVAQVARNFGTTRQSIMRIRAKQLEYHNMGQDLSGGA